MLWVLTASLFRPFFAASQPLPSYSVLLFLLLRHCLRTPQHQPTIRPITANLEPVDNLPQVYSHLMCHKEDAVYMVWHNLKSKHTHLWIMLGNLSPTTRNLTPQLRWFYISGCYSCSSTHKPSQQRLSSFRTERYHIDTPSLIVMPFKPP